VAVVTTCSDSACRQGGAGCAAVPLRSEPGDAAETRSPCPAIRPGESLFYVGFSPDVYSDFVFTPAAC
jgi:hypothetical protein